MAVPPLAYRVHCLGDWKLSISVADAGNPDLVIVYLCLRAVYRHARRLGWTGQIPALDGGITRTTLAMLSIQQQASEQSAPQRLTLDNSGPLKIEA